MHNAIAANNSAMHHADVGVSADVTNALLPNLSVQTSDEQPLPKIDLAVDHMPAQTFFLGLVKDSPYNIVIDPSITENISLHLKQVTVPEVLDVLEQSYGFEYSIENYGVYVTKGRIETKTFKVHYLNIQRTGLSRTHISSGEISQSQTDNASTSTTTTSSEDKPSSSVNTSSNSDFWKVLTETVNALVGDAPDTKVIINPDAGLVVVKAYPSTIKQVGQYLDDMQNIMNQQVILEAKILEVKLSKTYNAGVDWNVLGLSQDSNHTINDNLGLFTSMFTLDISDGSAFNAVINLLGTQGNVQVLSSPRISTLNNQKALIKVGRDEYFITNVSNTITGSSSTTENTQDVTMTPFFSGIALDVTPEISNNTDVTLHIHPMVSKVIDHTIDYTINGQAQELPSALSQIKETDNVVRAKNGQVVVIGGLMENEAEEYLGTTPYAEKIPFVGSLFRKTNQVSTNSELIILLRPIIVDNESLAPVLESISERFKKLKRGYHYGPYAERFGDTAETAEKTDVS